jgi:hypothetical protein
MPRLVVFQKSWKMPDYSEKERKDMPNHVFLLPSEKKFPYKAKDENGNWVIRPNMLRAAMTRAGQHGYPEIYKKAKKLYDKIKPTKVQKSAGPIGYTNVQKIGTIDEAKNKIKNYEEKIFDLMKKFKISKKQAEKQSILNEVSDYMSSYNELLRRSREIITDQKIDKKLSKSTTDAKQEKVHKVMKEFKEGKLKSSSGKTVTDREQAIAIAMSESGLSNQKACPGSKIRPKGKGQGLGIGQGSGPIGRQINKSKRLVLFSKG